jgi:hypothetical protein
VADAPPFAREAENNGGGKDKAGFYGFSGALDQLLRVGAFSYLEQKGIISGFNAEIEQLESGLPNLLEVCFRFLEDVAGIGRKIFRASRRYKAPSRISDLSSSQGRTRNFLVRYITQ